MAEGKKMQYNVVVTDFDGTLARSDNTVAESSVAAILEFIQKGGKFMVSTGRGPMGILHVVKDMGIEEGLVMCLQGNVICDVKTGELISCTGMEKEKAIEILLPFEEAGLNIVAYLNGIGHTKKITPFIKFYNDLNGAKSVETEIPLSEYLKKNDVIVNKIILIEEPAVIDEYSVRYKGFYPGIAVNKSASVLVEFTDERMNKGVSLQNFRKQFLSEEDKVICFGDTQIDISLLQAGNLGVAVANAMPEVKDAADVVTLSNDENGVEYMIRKYCLGEEI